MPRLEVHCDGKQIDMKDENSHVKIVFGPHHYINIFKRDHKVAFEIGATHHGFEIDASVVDSETYKMIEHVRKAITNNQLAGKNKD